MNRLTPLAIALFSLAPLTLPVHAGEPDGQVAAARHAIGELGKRLKAELQAGMEKGGPVAALEVCQTRAPEIAAEVSTDTDMHVSRTSLRTRNPANRPDRWELEGLLNFDRQREQGMAPEQMELSAVVEDQGRREFRYLKAIPTAELCLKCHGETLSPELSAALAQRYPEDQATGFKAGDIRGAFSVRQRLD